MLLESRIGSQSWPSLARTRASTTSGEPKWCSLEVVVDSGAGGIGGCQGDGAFGGVWRVARLQAGSDALASQW